MVTAPVKVAPLEFVTVKVAGGVATPIVPVAAKVIAPAVPASNVKLCVLATVPSTAPFTAIAPPNGLPPLFVVSIIDVVPARVTPVPASPMVIVSAELRTWPLSVTPLGAVAVKPPSNNNISPATLPKVRAPVLVKSTAAVMIVPLPNNSRS